MPVSVVSFTSTASRRVHTLPGAQAGRTGSGSSGPRRRTISNSAIRKPGGLSPSLHGSGAGLTPEVVSHRSMARLLGDDSPRSLTFATLFGIASSSCSYAAVALARSLFLKGASFTAAMVFELASTNLVIELGVMLVGLLGWPFAAGVFSGGIVMVVRLPVTFRLTLTPRP